MKPGPEISICVYGWGLFIAKDFFQKIHNNNLVKQNGSEIREIKKAENRSV